MENNVYLDPNTTLFYSAMAIDEQLNYGISADISYTNAIRRLLLVAILEFAFAVYLVVSWWDNLFMPVFGCTIFLVTAVADLVSYVRLGRALKVDFEEFAPRINGGQSPINYSVRFADKIYSHSDNLVRPVEHAYESIKSISENDGYYFLLIKSGGYITIEKSQVYDSRLGFADFIFSRCPNIKRRRVRNIRNGKKKCRAFIVSQFAAAFLLFVGWAAVHFTYFSAYYFG